MTVDPVGPQNRLSLTLLLQQVTIPLGGGAFSQSTEILTLRRNKSVGKQRWDNFLYLNV